MDSFTYLSGQKIVFIYGFVIMPNHVHVIWTVPDKNVKYVRHAFSSFTALALLKILKNDSELIEKITSNKKDRNNQIWKRRPHWKSLGSDKICIQKLRYIHNNPLQSKWKLVDHPGDYYWSSAKSYLDNAAEFDFLILREFYQ